MNFATWSWYSHQYRTRTITQTPYLARTGTNTSQVATAMAQQQNNAQTDNTNLNGKDKKSSEPLFGPSIGPVSSGPAWTIGSEKKVVTDELTPEIVNSWIEKSKEPSQPTTTLQALVNLKRPSLRLSPLSSAADDPSSANIADQHHHGLEFEYDCDAPKCGIYVHVHLPKSHPDAPSTSTTSLLSKLLVFETVVDGGFASHLKLEEGALLELGRFEHPHVQPLSHDTLPSSPEPSATFGDVASPTLATDASTPTASRNNGRRRFTHFNFRKRSQNRSISGPALAVVDAEPVVAQEGKTKEGKDDVEEGVKVTIRLAALDEQGTELASPNEQITYLHIVRLGHTTSEAPKEADELDHADARPWVVKVVKREATIGPHTFHLHEIYGLTSSSTNNANPTITPLSATHTYPPDEGQQIAPILSAVDNEDPQSECLLCLSSPREVVLLPCRHLVACKECALNMVEFGAGGTITQTVEGGVGPNEGAGAVSPVTPGTATAPAVPPPPTNQRRKRKAKGWFCPVCRQPYTSMLRITTTPPPQPESKDNEGSGTEDEGFPSAQIIDSNPNNSTAEVRGGLLASAFRPGFLRGLSLSRSTPVANPDVESQAGLGRVGA